MSSLLEVLYLLSFSDDFVESLLKTPSFTDGSLLNCITHLLLLVSFLFSPPPTIFFLGITVLQPPTQCKEMISRTLRILQLLCEKEDPSFLAAARLQQEQSNRLLEAIVSLASRT